jgi:hypothetical protein
LTLIQAGKLLSLANVGRPGETPAEVPAGYQIEKVLTLVGRQITPGEEFIINLTGGTKMMAIGAFAAAMQRKAGFVYLESERKHSVLYHHHFDAQGVIQPATAQTLPGLITIDEYLRAHVDGYTLAPPPAPQNAEERVGFAFEQAVQQALAGRVDEVLASVKPGGVANQIEIDLLIRCDNQVAAAEIKVGRGDEGPKKGIDQLATATAREYLGTYTGRLLITANQQTPKIRQLATEKGITLLTARRFGEHKIEPGDQRQLIAEIRKLLGATHDEGMQPT